jgi:hypothetical protein
MAVSKANFTPAFLVLVFRLTNALIYSFSVSFKASSSLSLFNSATATSVFSLGGSGGLRES